MDWKTIINKLQKDEFGRPSGILAINKPAGISTHDVVDEVRKVLGTRRVGHAGALDNFATGLVLILVGKFTKRAEQLLNLDKKYLSQVLFGLSTDTQDTEGRITALKINPKLKNSEIATAVNSFQGEYEQYVSAYSSVKVDGKKLRKLMRDKRYLAEVVEKKGIKYIVLRKTDDPEFLQEVAIPKRKVEIYKISLLGVKKISKTDSEFLQGKSEINERAEFITAEIDIHCSKGTYIRQLAEDLGEKLKVPAMLIKLERTAISDITIDMALELTELQERFSSL